MQFVVVVERSSVSGAAIAAEPRYVQTCCRVKTAALVSRPQLETWMLMSSEHGPAAAAAITRTRYRPPQQPVTD